MKVSFLSKIKTFPKSYWSLSSATFIYYIVVACGGFLTVFLQQRGFQAHQVGFINAFSMAFSIVAAPFWGMIADKIGSIRKVFMLTLGISAVLWALVPLTSGITLGPLIVMYLVIIPGAFFRNPTQSLMDGYLIQLSDKDGLPYGHVRLWGSFSWAAMCILLGIIIPRTGVEFSFYIHGIMTIPVLLIMWKMKDTAPKSAGEKTSLKKMGFGRLLKNYYFITYLIVAVFLHMPLSTSMNFLPFLIANVGGDTNLYGLVIGYRGFLEIPMLFLMRAIRRKFPLPVAIIGSAVLYCTEAFFYSRATSFTHIILVQILHGLGQGLMHGSVTNYVFSLAPEGLNSTAHTIHGSVRSAAGILGNLLGGYLIFSLGIKLFYSTVFFMILFAIAFFLITLFIGIKILKKPLPQMKAV